MELIRSVFPLKGVVDSRIGGRDENQDGYAYSDTPMGPIIVVCDGMGGMQGGRIASAMAVSSIVNSVKIAFKDDDPQEVLRKAIEKANQDIIQAASGNPELYGMGTTVTAMLVTPHCATIAHLGDSRIYQLRGKSKHYRTFDHSLVFEMVKNGVFTEEQARQSNQSNIILRALGVGAEVEPEICQLPYSKGDRFVLCTDGFWGCMPEKELIKHLTQKHKIGHIIEKTANVVDKIGQAKGGTHDNLTAAMVELKCNSIMKEKMSKKVKILLIALSVALLSSVVLNVVLLCKNTNKAKVEPATEVVADTASAVQ
ncbi:MAG: serine/threonine-protein phosphatase [Alistipes sp.]|nr:serine/threonine-protein phosphatase [Alistipes sp.]